MIRLVQDSYAMRYGTSSPYDYQRGHDRDMEYVRIYIHHRVQDGYLLAANGEEIKEELMLREFMSRFRNILSVSKIQQVEEAIYRMLKGTDMTGLQSAAGWLDNLYSTQIREGKLVLAQHKTVLERDITNDAEELNKRAEKKELAKAETTLKPFQIKQKEDEDIIYLLA